MNEKLSVLETSIKSELITGIILGLIFIVMGYIMIYYPDLLKNLETK